VGGGGEEGWVGGLLAGLGEGVCASVCGGGGSEARIYVHRYTHICRMLCGLFLTYF